MMETIRLNLALYHVPVIAGKDLGQSRTVPDGKRLARLGDVPARYLPPPPRVQAPLAPLCPRCGIRHG